MNQLYQIAANGGLSNGMQSMPSAPAFQNPMPSAPAFQNPMQMVMQAMANPVPFIKNRFPDIPDSIMNDPNQILAYLQRTRGITNQQLQQLPMTYGGMRL